MSTNEMNAKARALKRMKAKAEQLAEQMAALEAEIKAEMEAQGIEEVTAGTVKIRWAKITSNRFDSTGFRKAMPDLYERFTKITESRRFTIA
jgi:predicted phage-related endonuclease